MPELDSETIRLTETVQKGGCAAKLPAGQLRDILKKLNMHKPASLTVGTEHMDDACLWDLGNGQSLVQTLDFFTPIVDDAYDFGAIAAANAISDVYAMGGVPKIALSILAFPAQTLPISLLEPLLRGALDKIQEAGACLAGGHTIDDDTLKFGLSVTGFVPKDRAWTNSGAREGDALILTKGLGTGTLTSALKRRELKEEFLAPLIASMKLLNRAPELLGDEEVHAATDITGFGLAGHSLQLARASEVNLEIDTAKLPLLPGAMASLQNKILNRAHKTNWDYVNEEVNFLREEEEWKWLAMDPQTSGGLLLAVPFARAQAICQRLLESFPQTAIIGSVVKKNSPHRILFK
ncbi:MAG: selenide, water dikinase SelD [Bdellovibrionota bacterium]